MLNRLIVDAGSGYIKLIHGHNIAGKIKIKHIDIVESPQNMIADGRIIKVPLFADLINTYLTSHRLKPFSISFVLHSSEIIIKLIKLPKMKDKNIRNSIEWELTEMYKLKLEKYYFDYEVYENEYNNFADIQIVLVPRELIDQFEEVSKITGISLKYIDIASKCLLRLLKSFYSDFVILDYGHQSIRLSLYFNKRVFADHEYNFCNYRTIITDQSSTAAASINEELLINKLSRMLDFFISHKSENKLENIFIVGGQEFSGNFLDYLSQNYVQPIRLNETNKRYDKLLENNKDKLRLYSNALGLFIRM